MERNRSEKLYSPTDNKSNKLCKRFRHTLSSSGTVTNITENGSAAAAASPSSSYHLSLNSEGRWGTTDDFAPPFSPVLWDLANSRPVHSLMWSSHLFLCLPCLLPPFTVPCKMVSALPDKRETCPYHCSLCLFTIVRRSSCGLMACWILARTSSLIT